MKLRALKPEKRPPSWSCDCHLSADSSWVDYDRFCLHAKKNFQLRYVVFVEEPLIDRLGQDPRALS